MVRLLLELLGHVPVVVYVIIYVDGKLADTSIAPVTELMFNPMGAAEKLPPARPVIVGVGSESFIQ